MIRNKAIGDIGHLDRKITIKRQSVATTELFAKTISWVTVATPWAKVQYMARKQMEGQYGGQEVAFQQVSFIVRHPIDYSVDTTCRIEYDGDEYDIITIMKDIGRNQYWELVTELRK